jgi:2-polyprenyl-3-methyl-5-hydroxy-6-metoxy-1,4-benzoquinol methylase
MTSKDDGSVLRCDQTHHARNTTVMSYSQSQKACLLWLLVLAMIVSHAWGKEQWIFQSEKKWDKEWSSGAWHYQEKVPVERSRIAVIGGVLVQLYAPSANSTVLEIGCGEGAVTDFLTPPQKLGYVGVDISKEAIAIAKTKRKAGGMRFVHAAAHKFEPLGKFDVVIFSEVLYYTEYEKILDQYQGYMNPNAILIISIFQMTGKPKYENIFAYAQSKFTMVDEIEVSGKTKKLGGDNSPVEKTAFRIEVLRKKN